jgi:hypothetical protein
MRYDSLMVTQTALVPLGSDKVFFINKTEQQSYFVIQNNFAVIITDNLKGKT